MTIGQSQVKLDSIEFVNNKGALSQANTLLVPVGRVVAAEAGAAERNCSPMAAVASRSAAETAGTMLSFRRT
jgi:hypothetical protein